MARRLAGFAALLLLSLCARAERETQLNAGSRELRVGWRLQSACATHATGETISSVGFAAKDWIPTTVPHTVLGAQVDAGVFHNPYFGMNLRDIPGTDYPIGKIFGYFPMSASSPYHCSWWYRTEFRSTAAPGRPVRLHFDGINYRANIWLNGRLLADAEHVAGAFRAYDFDVTHDLTRGKSNALAIEVFAQSETDLGLDFLDWNPAPADKNMGLWRGVSIQSGSASIGNPVVITHFADDALTEADLTVAADVTNQSSLPLRGILNGTIGRIVFRQSIALAAGERKVVRFTANQFPQLRVRQPRVWWPYQYGDPHMEVLRLTLDVDGAAADEKTVRVGIREAQQTLDKRGHTVFQVNRRKILIRGGGWTPDLFYREPHARLVHEMEYVRQMHLNAIRLEGKLGSEDLFDLADRMGVLVMAGWQCCDHWQHWDKWTPADHTIAHDSLYNQITRLRSHPSLLVWLNGSDEAPAPMVEEDFLAVLKERDWPAAVLSTAAARTSLLSGASGVKMSGPYDYVPPEFWYLDKDKAGGAFGFNTETGPGAAIPLQSSIRRTLPESSWWPIDDEWRFHAALGKFAQYDAFNQAMDATYGEAKDAAGYNLQAQWMAYDGERAMFEAYGANKYVATGVIQWLLNNAWPSFFWHLYDYYLVPGGGYFGTKKANEPLHVQYRYDNANVVVVNSTLKRYDDLAVRARIFALDGTELWSQRATLCIGPDSVARAITVPQQKATTFLQLELRNVEGKSISENVYALPSTLAELDWAKSTYVYTPAKRYAEMLDLRDMAKSHVTAWVAQGKSSGDFSIMLRNDGRAVAFCLQLRATEGEKDMDLAPVLWSDNYISLVPGEARAVTVHLAGKDAGHPKFKLEGWNLPSQAIRFQPE